MYNESLNILLGDSNGKQDSNEKQQQNLDFTCSQKTRISPISTQKLNEIYNQYVSLEEARLCTSHLSLSQRGY